MMRGIRMLGLVAGTFTLIVGSAASAAPPSFTVTGPIPATLDSVTHVTQIPGNYERGYPFFATNHDLATRGYVEEEFFISGTATEYGTYMSSPYTDPRYTSTASFLSGNHPYKTRMVVRRPADPKRFNGTVLVEWDNVTNGFDAENVWFFAWEHVLRGGYAWVGVSAQRVGVNRLVSWSSTVPTAAAPRASTPYVPSHRYDGFTVSCATGTCTSSDADVLSFDIFTQAGQAIRTVDMLGGLRPKRLIATGESQSAMRLATYANQVDPLAKVYDGFLLLSPVGQPIRSDIRVPTFKVLTEWDVYQGEAAVRQADSAKFRTWEVAGASHVDHHLRGSREPLELRDFSTNTVASSSEATVAGQCDIPTIGTRVGTSYVVAAAFDALVDWIAKDRAPAYAPRIEVSNVTPPATIVRDSLGRALGGIRLAAFEVPVGLSIGIGGPVSLACVRWGGYLPFTVDQLNEMYPSHGAYVSAVEQITRYNLHNGYILRPDADFTIKQAVDSGIGKLDDPQVDLGTPMADFDRNP